MNNTCFILGRLGKAPIKRESNGFSTALMSVATNDFYKKENGEYETITDWVSVKALGKISDLVSNWDKGDMVSIEGKITSESWTDKNSGEKKYSQHLIAQKVKRVSKYDPSKAEGMINVTTEDIPF